MERNVRISLSHWIFIDDTKFFGPGRVQLLENIEKTGSIVKAAQEMEMSYKKAWDMVVALNTLGKSPYVVTHKGGQKGGGAELTETGKQVLAAYKKLGEKLKAVADAEQELINLI
ncbi:winged helix-turn-helix domain-containing protein [Emticicia sp. C21]|uniref:winged helix-turn-helix domain-containing protein n=1 Tax=Emticicia sp. C21 TaxID=2302915 RepID=UPI000E35283A|nr:LysR family transcriptional regulator [Emticicia sp. C21]RFS17733.1 LysR family transcriptional regulator [Emticicia sp. C21]